MYLPGGLIQARIGATDYIFRLVGISGTELNNSRNVVTARALLIADTNDTNSRLSELVGDLPTGGEVRN